MANVPAGVRRLTLAFALPVTMLLVSGSARADDPAPKWPMTTPTISWWDAAITVGAGATTLAVYYEVPLAQKPHWDGPILFDQFARDHLRQTSPAALEHVRTASDDMSFLSFGWMVADTAITPVVRGDPGLALRLQVINLEAYAVGTMLIIPTYTFVGRARPSYDDCQRNPSFDTLCNSGSTASFPSGHTGTASIGAGLACIHHQKLELWGDPLADGLACATGIAFAVTTGVLRVMGDRHWASDVLTGGIIGFSSGYFLPMLLHYRAPVVQVAGAQLSIVPNVTLAGGGLTMVGAM